MFDTLAKEPIGTTFKTHGIPCVFFVGVKHRGGESTNPHSPSPCCTSQRNYQVTHISMTRDQLYCPPRRCRYWSGFTAGTITSFLLMALTFCTVVWMGK